MSEIDLLYFGMTGIFLHLFRFDKLSQLEQSYLISPLGFVVIQSYNVHTLRKKKESQNGSPRKAVWSSVTQLSMELHFGALLYKRESIFKITLQV